MGGQNQSTATNDDVVLEQFSDVERRILDQYCSRDVSWNREKCKQELTNKLPDEICENVVKYLENENKISQNHLWFQKAVLKLTKGMIEDVARAFFFMICNGNDNVTKEHMNKCIISLLLTMKVGQTELLKTNKTDCENFTELLLKEFPTVFNEDKFNDLLHRNSLLVDVLQNRFYVCFFGKIPEISNNLKGAMPVYIPLLMKDQKTHSDLSLSTVAFINSKLPLECQHEWTMLYSSTTHGESFAKLCSNIINKGPVVVVVTDSDGYKFGGFISVSCNQSAQFQGDRRSFVFSLFPKFEAFAPTGYNDHFMYLNIGQGTLPNGFGMGGQHDFFGFWIDSEFGSGHSRAKPTSTTFGSPQLSKKENFKIHNLEVWGVGKPPKKDEDVEEMSVLDKHVDAQAFLEIAGKSRVSEGLREADPEADIPEDKELYLAHDPMQ